MRGIEASLAVFERLDRGEYASEALRKVLDKVERRTERTLATGLVYGALRKQLLWEHLLKKVLRVSWEDLPRDVQHSFILGAGGLMTLEHFAPPVLVSALVFLLHGKGYQKETSLLNATLRHFRTKTAPFVEELQKKDDLFALGLLQGLPRWFVQDVKMLYGHKQARRILGFYGEIPCTALRLHSPEFACGVKEELESRSLESCVSPILDFSLRVAGTCFVSELSCYKRGEITPQAETSMGISLFFPCLGEKPRILDMCAGRGGKTGLLAWHYTDAFVEGWELSEPKLRAMEKDMLRLGFHQQVCSRCGNALELEDSQGFDMILLDAPCSGTGTWQRHPESKTRIKPRDVRALQHLQKDLLFRAGELVRPGGYILYATCSLLRQENEEVLAEILKRNQRLVEIPLKENPLFTEDGKPWGRYAFPSEPWKDGFYVALLMKRPEEAEM